MRPFITIMAGLMLSWPAQLAAAQQNNITLTLHGCQVYAAWSGNLVWASDLDAEKDKARDELARLDQKTPSSIYALMLKNLDALWDTSASWEQVTALVFNDCMTRRGTYDVPER
jgi:hypothetical protein